MRPCNSILTIPAGTITFPSWRPIREGDYARALIETTRFSSPGFYWDALLRTAVSGQLGHADEAAIQLAQLQNLLPKSELDLATLMQRTVLTDENVSCLLVGLRRAGLPPGLA